MDAKCAKVTGAIRTKCVINKLKLPKSHFYVTFTLLSQFFRGRLYPLYVL